MKKVTFPAAIAAIAALVSTQPVYAVEYQVDVVNLTRGIHFTPLLVSAHTPSASIFVAGSAASTELQTVAESGDTTSLGALLDSLSATVVNGDALVVPGATATFTISNTATPDNTHLSVVGMLLPTNDGFVGLNSIELPTGVSGTRMTYTALGYDAGTEANNELVGTGAVGEPGFPAPPPVVASGTGTGGTGVTSSPEGFVHVHRNVLGDNDAAGGESDINSTVHRWLNPVARIIVTITGN